MKNKNVISPVLKPRVSNEVSVVFACDKKYASCLIVCLYSLKEHISSEREYTIYVLNEDGLTERIRAEFSMLETEKFKICIVNIGNLLAHYPTGLFYEIAHFSLAIYYRLFIPDLFGSFEKIVYCDCDGIFLGDVAELYDLELNQYWLGAAKDQGVICQLFNGDRYYKEQLGLTEPIQYFNSGMLVFNIKEQKKHHFTEKCLSILEKMGNLRYPDQDILNIVCEGKVKFFPGNWNVENLVWSWKNLDCRMPTKDYEEFIRNTKDMKFLHYTGAFKPWITPLFLNAHMWWHVARKTSLYEIILRDHIWEMPKKAFWLPHNYILYMMFRFLRHIVWGKKRQHFKEKEEKYRKYVKTITKWISDN